MHAAPLLLAALGALHDCCAPQAYSNASTDTCYNSSQQCILGMCMSSCSKNDDCVSTPARPGYAGTPLCLGGYCAFAVTQDDLGKVVVDSTVNEAHCVRPQKAEGDFRCCENDAGCESGSTCKQGQCIFEAHACVSSDGCPEGSTCFYHEADEKSWCRGSKCSAASSARPAAALLAVCLALARA